MCIGFYSACNCCLLLFLNVYSLREGPGKSFGNVLEFVVVTKSVGSLGGNAAFSSLPK